MFCCTYVSDIFVTNILGMQITSVKRTISWALYWGSFVLAFKLLTLRRVKFAMLLKYWFGWEKKIQISKPSVAAHHYRLRRVWITVLSAPAASTNRNGRPFSVRLSPVRCARASQPFFNVSCARVCVSVRVCVRTTVCTFLFIIIINIIIIIFDRFFSSITRFAVGLNATTFV